MGRGLENAPTIERHVPAARRRRWQAQARTPAKTSAIVTENAATGSLSSLVEAGERYSQGSTELLRAPRASSRSQRVLRQSTLRTAIYSKRSNRPRTKLSQLSRRGGRRDTPWPPRQRLVPTCTASALRSRWFGAAGGSAQPVVRRSSRLAVTAVFVLSLLALALWLLVRLVECCPALGAREIER